MDAPARRRAAVFVVPLIIALVSARRAAPNVRTVDMELIRSLRTPRGPDG